MDEPVGLTTVVFAVSHHPIAPWSHLGPERVAGRMVPEWTSDIDRVALTEEQIQQRVTELAAVLSHDLVGKQPLLVGVLMGSIVFVADLIRQLTIPFEMDFIAVSSYGRGAETEGRVRLLKDLSIDPRGRWVVLVEDIVDTGITLDWLVRHLRGRGGAELRVCALMDKPSRRRRSSQLDYIGFQVPDEFLVGYGLDYAHQYRGLPYVAVLKRALYGEVTCRAEPFTPE